MVTDKFLLGLQSVLFLATLLEVDKKDCQKELYDQTDGTREVDKMGSHDLSFGPVVQYLGLPTLIRNMDKLL